MATVGGFGATVNIMVTGSSAAIADLLDVEFPEQEKIVVDSTSHGATGSYAQFIDTGLRQLNPFKMTLGWDSDEATHARILGCFGLTSGVAMSVVSPGTDETIYFTCHIQKIGRVSKMKDAYKADVTVQPYGPPTIS